MNIKRLLILAAIAFVVYYALRSPDAAASAFKGAGEVTLSGLKGLFESLVKFVTALFH